MGEVYRARDTTLNRDVAIKVLPQAFANDSGRLARFTREAQTLAALNHLNIAHIHGLEASGGVPALVMELVEGEDLSQRITRGAIPIGDALPIARQVAEALEAAHDQGIVHRDLKPANIKVRPDGTVKVLDFGLANATEPPGTASHISNAATITSPAMTQMGTILGTVAYMSPEQAKGCPVDRRGDLWAFGAVLLEMLTGRLAFKGDDVSDTIAFILTREPDWAALPAETPPVIRRLLRRCLEKDRKRRLDSAADARLEIEEALNGSPAVDGTAAQPAPAPRTAWSRALTWTWTASTLGLAIALGLALWASWRGEQSSEQPLLRLDVDLGAEVSMPLPPTAGSSIAISPDGTRLAYASGDPSRLFVRRLDQSTATELPGTQGAAVPLFSPDGQWVGFVAGTRLSKVSVEGGAAVAIGDVAGTHVSGAHWGEESGVLVSEAFGNRGLIRLPAGGGPPQTIMGLGSEEIAFAVPRLLPGGKAILFATDTGMDVDTITIEVLTLGNRKRKIVARGGHSPRYLPAPGGSGYLVYTNRAELFAIPFDLETLETRGTAVRILDDVAYNSLNKGGQFDISRTGTLVYRRTSGEAQMTVQWVDPTGKKEALRANAGSYEHPCLSPDGKRIALTSSDGGNRDVWIVDPERDAMTRLTFGGYNIEPKWSPDGQSLVFSTLGKGLFRVRMDGASQPQALMRTKTFLRPWSFTPDGKRLAYFETSVANPQILTLPLVDEGVKWKVGQPEPFSRNPYTERLPSFSPDGRWLAYDSDESGRTEVYVRAFPPPASGQGGKGQISNNGGTGARWSRTAPEIVYRSGDQVMAVKYTIAGDRIVAEKPRTWIEKLGGTAWDLAPDGRRVAVLTSVRSGEAPAREHEVVLLLNFIDELRRRLPTGK
jgi:serine/threonine protein kinase/Tol biopolymer transport system component